MELKSARALKEWAAIEQVLAAGEVSVLLRKGGLWERREGFEMEHRQFWLFPTLYHQNPEELRPELAWALQSAQEAQPAGEQIRLEHFAVVSEAYRVEKLETLLDVADRQALTQATVESRFEYRNRPYLHLLLLRVYRIPAPHLIRNTLGYEGCVSWVELDEALPTSGAVPVLDDRAFARVREEVTRSLGAGEGVIQV